MSDQRIVDFLIVGQGLVGTVLAHELIRRKKTILIIDQFNPTSASRTAAGLFNPFVFKWITKSWIADTLLPLLLETYGDIEATINKSVLHQNGIVRVITSLKEADRWERKISRADYAAHIGDELTNLPDPALRSHFGHIHIKTAGWLDISSMIDNYRERLLKNDQLIDDTFNHDALDPESETYKNVKFSHIVFCEGAGADQNPYFNHLAFKHTKGEVLDISVPEIELQHCLNYGQFIVPRKNGVFRTGTTYDWKELNSSPSEEGKEKILRNHREFFGGQPKVLDHKAGIRPTAADRRPFVGRHPQHPSLSILNATGSKGVMLAPWCVQQLVEHLINGEPLHPEIDVNRIVKT